MRARIRSGERSDVLVRLTDRRLFHVAYALSGTAALLYEVAWSRLLTLHMGHTVAAVSTVLAAYMGGLAAGSIIGGTVSARLSRRRALQFYAGLEVLIAASALVLPAALSALQPLLARAYADGTGGTYFGLVRLATSLIILGIPTTAMGATFPIAARWAVRDDRRAGAEAGGLYAANTIGAAAGAVLAGFVLLPAIGLRLTTLVGGLFNVTAAAAAYWVSSRILAADDAASPVAPPARQVTAPAPGRRARKAVRPEALPASRHPGRPWLGAAALACSGFVALVYEVTWTRVLALIVGPTSYAFSAMLAAFIGGLAIGSAVGSRVAGRARQPALWLAFCLELTAASALGVFGLIDRVPLVVARATSNPTAAFGSMLLLQGGVAAILLLPVTLMLGAAFPLAIAVATRRLDTAPRDIATVYAANTLGAIAGALAAGFVLIPAVGLQHTIVGSSIAVAAAGFAVAMAGVSGLRPRLAGATVAAAAIVTALLLPAWNRDLVTSGAYKYAPYLAGLDVESALTAGTTLYYAEGAVGTVTVRRSAGTTTLAIDGKIDASNSGDMLTQKLLGHVPLLLHPAPDSVCIIGLGSGVTLEAAARHPVGRIDVLEISPEVVEASAFFRAENRDVLRDPRVRLIVGDGRSHMMLSTRRYDVIISEPSNPWMAGMSALFTREFFASVRRRLAPGGLFCQWAHSYDMSAADLQSIIATFLREFPHATLWLVGEGDVLLVGGAPPIDPLLAGVATHWSRPGVAADLAQVSVRDPFSVISLVAAGETALRTAAGSAAIQSDDRMALEYSAPRAIYGASKKVGLDRLLGPDTPARLPEVVRRALAGASATEWRGRGQMLMAAASAALAYPSFARAVDLDPRDAAALDGLLRSATAAAAIDEVRRRLRAMCLADPSNLQARVAVSRLQASEGDWSGAVATSREALAIDPRSAEAREQLASIYADTGDADSLDPIVSDMLASDPQRAATLYYAGTARYLRGRLDDAAQLADAATRADPAFARAWILAGAAYGSLGQPDRAAAALRAGLAADPKNVAAYLNLGMIEMARGDVPRAAGTFAEALAVEPGYEPARAALADALERMGHADRAAALRRARPAR